MRSFKMNSNLTTKTKLVFSFILILSIIFIISGCGNGKQVQVENNDNQDVVTLKFSDVNAENSPAGTFANTFKDIVEKETDGRIEIEIYYGGTLADNDIESVQTGVADLSQHDVSEITDLSKLLSILEAPYLYENEEELFEITEPNSEIMKIINDDLSGSGVQLIATYSWGNQQLLSNKPVYNSEDLKGLKVRVLPSDIFVKTMEAMGGTATPMSWSEVTTSLMTNMIDGTGLPFTYVVDTGLEEIVKYCIMTEHNPTLSGVFINEDSWDSISDDDKIILQEAGVIAQKAVSEDIRVNNEKKREIMLDAGMEIIEHDEIDMDWDEIRDQVFNEFESDWGDIYQKILDILDK